MESRPSQRYTLLEDQSSEKPTSRSAASTKKLIILIASCVFLSLAFLAVIGVAIQQNVASRTTSTTQSGHVQTPRWCGSTRDEALSAGCHFDIMSSAWFPQECFDEELIAGFEARGPWQWFMDREGREVAPESQVRQGLLDRLYVTWEFHRLHCTFQWKKMHRAILAGRPIDSYIGNLSHTQALRGYAHDNRHTSRLNWHGHFHQVSHMWVVELKL